MSPPCGGNEYSKIPKRNSGQYEFDGLKEIIRKMAKIYKKKLLYL